MNSRVSLSILAAFTGAALMYVVITFFNLPVETSHTLVTRVLVLFGILCVAAGWLMIFRRRPAQKPAGE